MASMSRDLNDVHFGYIVDTQDDTVFIAGEKDNTSWIQAFPYGEWSHPEYGKIAMDANRAARMAANVNQRIRDQDLPINYDHGEQRKDAAGWVQKADVRPDGLWLNVEWTREAYQKIKNKAYKYFSPEYMNSWKHPRTNAKFDDVLVGGALVNMPHLKGILPLNLSEYFIACSEEIEDELGKMDDMALAEMTRKSINDLPDSDFAYIESGGEKDSEGKTVPRSLRHFPIHDESHVRNALARAPQSPHGDKALPKIRAAAKKMGIKVSASEDTRGILEMIAYVHDIKFNEKTSDKDLFDQVAEAVRTKKSKKTKKSSWVYGEKPGGIIEQLREEDYSQFDLTYTAKENLDGA